MLVKVLLAVARHRGTGGAQIFQTKTEYLYKFHELLLQLRAGGQRQLLPVGFVLERGKRPSRGFHLQLLSLIS